MYESYIELESSLAWYPIESFIWYPIDYIAKKKAMLRLVLCNIFLDWKYIFMWGMHKIILNTLPCLPYD